MELKFNVFNAMTVMRLLTNPYLFLLNTFSHEGGSSWLRQDFTRGLDPSHRQRHDTLQALIGPFETRK